MWTSDQLFPAAVVWPPPGLALLMSVYQYHIQSLPLLRVLCLLSTALHELPGMICICRSHC